MEKRTAEDIKKDMQAKIKEIDSAPALVTAPVTAPVEEAAPELIEDEKPPVLVKDADWEIWETRAFKVRAKTKEEAIEKFNNRNSLFIETIEVKARLKK